MPSWTSKALLLTNALFYESCVNKRALQLSDKIVSDVAQSSGVSSGKDCTSPRHNQHDGVRESVAIAL